MTIDNHRHVLLNMMYNVNLNYMVSLRHPLLNMMYNVTLNYIVKIRHFFLEVVYGFNLMYRELLILSSHVIEPARGAGC